MLLSRDDFQSIAVSESQRLNSILIDVHHRLSQLFRFEAPATIVSPVVIAAATSSFCCSLHTTLPTMSPTAAGYYTVVIVVAHKGRGFSSLLVPFCRARANMTRRDVLGCSIGPVFGWISSYFFSFFLHCFFLVCVIVHCVIDFSCGELVVGFFPRTYLFFVT